MKKFEVGGRVGSSKFGAGGVKLDSRIVLAKSEEDAILVFRTTVCSYVHEPWALPYEGKRRPSQRHQYWTREEAATRLPDSF